MNRGVVVVAVTAGLVFGLISNHWLVALPVALGVGLMYVIEGRVRS